MISQIGPTLHRIAIVVLEGFGAQDGGGALRPLESLGSPVIKCGPGMLMETLQSLENLGGPLLSTVSGAAVNVPGGKG